jgi:hypothetical protein
MLSSEALHLVENRFGTGGGGGSAGPGLGVVGGVGDGAGGLGWGFGKVGPGVGLGGSAAVADDAGAPTVRIAHIEPAIKYSKRGSIVFSVYAA